MNYLEIVNKVDTFPYDGVPNHYFRFLSHDGVLLGYMTADIGELFRGELDFSVDTSNKTVQMGSHLATFAARNDAFAAVAAAWRKLPQFADSLDKGWRGELYTVYNPLAKPYMLLERAFLVLLGVVTYGAHINGYVPASKSKDGKMRLWIARRSLTKPTFPGKLDNTVAGGLGYPHGINETVVKECQEEAGLEPSFVNLHLKPTGVVLYMIQPDGPDRQVQPEVEYTFDLEFDDETLVVPQPEDGEVGSFTLMTLEELLPKLESKEFKPNCALVIVDFLIRHGLIDAETPGLLEVVNRSHRRLPFPTR